MSELIGIDGRPARRWRNGRPGPAGQCSWCGAVWAAGPRCPVHLLADACRDAFGSVTEPAEWRCRGCWDGDAPAEAAGPGRIAAEPTCR